MKKITLLPFLLLLVSCISAGKLEQVYEFPLNPTSYEYPVSQAAMHGKLISVFSYSHQIQSSFYKDLNIINADYPKRISEYALFRLEQTADDEFRLSTNDFLKSYVYQDSGNPVTLFVEYQLTTTAIGDARVKVSIIPTKIRAFYGIKCCGHFGMTTKMKLVPTETIVEYQLLRYIGDMLGLNNMPALVLPKEKTQKKRK